jgi:transcriptional regulator with PAS, ATPase and Fis domain
MSSSMIRAAQLSERSETPSALDMPGLTTSLNLQMQDIYKLANRAAGADVTVLITGESGTGKELLARELHQLSRRRNGPFIALNCGAIPASLFESELFGYEKGAFTGAARTTIGKIEAAHGGTLFLDEIGELDLSLQPKLLRFLQDKTFYRVGGTRAIDADVRIIAATNRNLNDAVLNGSFREDFYYRINVVHFELPPLRERMEDLPALTSHLVEKTAAKLGKKVLAANESALSLLQRYDWPGNIRELENAIERAVLLSRGKFLTASDFSHIDAAIRKSAVNAEKERSTKVTPLAEMEKQCIARALAVFGGNQARAAEALGVHRNTLRSKIAEYRIDTKG